MTATLYRIIAFIAAFCMAAMMVVTILDAGGRYFFSAPLHGAIEYISYFLGVLILSAYALATRDRGHIVVGLFSELYPQWIARIERVLTALATFGGTIFITWLLVNQGLSYQRLSRVGDTLQIPLAWLVFGLAGLAAIASLFAALVVWESITNRISPPKGTHQS